MTNSTQTPKNKNLRRGLIAAGVSTALLVGGVALADGHRGRGGGGMGIGFMRLIKHLDLTEEQEVKAVRLRHQMQEERKTGQVDRQAMMKTTAAELAKPAPDAQKLHALADTAMQRMSKMTHSTIDKFLELHKTFTSEQRTKLSTKIENMADRKDRKERKQRRRRRGGD